MCLTRYVIYSFKATAMLLPTFTQVAGIFMFCPKTTQGPTQVGQLQQAEHLVTETDTISYSVIIFHSSGMVTANTQLSDCNTQRFSWHMKTNGPETIVYAKALDGKTNYPISLPISKIPGLSQCPCVSQCHPKDISETSYWYDTARIYSFKCSFLFPSHPHIEI